MCEHWRKLRNRAVRSRARRQGRGSRVGFYILGLILLSFSLTFLPFPSSAGIAKPSAPPQETKRSSPKGNGPQLGPDLPWNSEGMRDLGSREGKPSAKILPVEINGPVSTHLKMYQTKHKDSLLESFPRAEAHIVLVKEIFDKAGLPGDLSNLAFLESGFNPFAYSRRGASGIWQFMESTARLFGLQINWWVDERRDPEKSTWAAAQYLKRLYRIFNSWPLAIAAYNAGEDKILVALRGRTQADFWSLQLPRETWRLVSCFMAITLILRDPEAYLFPSLQEETPRYTKVLIDSCTDLRVIAKACDVPYQEIHALNPELNWGCTPPDRTQYEVRIPLEAKYRFGESFSTIPAHERITWTRHRVKKGESLAQISKCYRVPVAMVRQMNHLPSGLLSEGKDLLLPIPHEFQAKAKNSRGTSSRSSL